MGRFRDAITGFFTTRKHAEANPATTVRETIRRPRQLGRHIGPAEFAPGLGLRAGELARSAIDELYRAAKAGKLRSGHASSGIHLPGFGKAHINVEVTITAAPNPEG